MAWSAFAAGFSKGFGEELSEGIKQRRQEQNKYVDNMMDTAKAWQPKFLQANAKVDSDLELMKVMNTEFGISESEFVALAQNYDMADIYSKSVTARQAFKEVGLDENAVNRDTLLAGLSLPKDFSLPEGMTATDAMRQIHMGYAKNLAVDPSNKTDAHQQTSFAKAVAGVLMLDPRSSAERIANQMQVMGIPVEELNMFAATGGVKGKPIGNVTRTGAFVLPNTDYSSTSFNTTLNSSRASLYRTMLDLTDPNAVIGDAGQEAVRMMLKEDNNNKNINETNLATFIESGAGKFGQLEKQLINEGMSIGFNTRGMRDMALSSVRAQINTIDELDNFSEAVKSGKASALIIESVRKTGEVTMETINEILGGETERGDGTNNGLTVTPEADEVVTLENNNLSDLENLQREMELTGPEAAETVDPLAQPTVESSLVGGLIDRNKKPPADSPNTRDALEDQPEPVAPEVISIAKRLAIPVAEDGPVISTTTDTSPRVAPFMERAMKPIADLLESPTKELAESIKGPVRKLGAIIKQPAEATSAVLTEYMKPLKDAIAAGRTGASKDVSLGDLFSDWFSTTFPGAKLPANPLETVDFVAGTMSPDFVADPTGDTAPTILDIVPREQAFEVLVYSAAMAVTNQGVTFQDKEVAKQWLLDFLEKEEDFLIKTGLANEETGEYISDSTIDLMANILHVGYGS